MDFIKDMIYINKSSLIKTIKSLKENWLLIFTGIIYTVLNLIIFSLLSIFLKGILLILSGIIMAIITSSFISNYLYLLYNVINYNRLTFQDFKEGFKYFLWKIYGVLFIGYLGNYFLSIIGNFVGGGVLFLNVIIYLGVLVILNPLPETIYLKDYTPWETVLKTLEFMQENWLNWIVPNIVFHLALYFLTGNILTNLFNTHISFGFNYGITNILLYLIGQGLFTFIMIYRGHLYKLLSGSTRRKRMFMNKF